MIRCQRPNFPIPSQIKYDWAYPSRDQPIRILRNTRVVVDQLTGASIGGTQPEPQYCVVPEELRSNFV